MRKKGVAEARDARKANLLILNVYVYYLCDDDLVKATVDELQVLGDEVGVPLHHLVRLVGPGHEEAVALERLDGRGRVAGQRALGLLDVGALLKTVEGWTRYDRVSSFTPKVPKTLTQLPTSIQ